MPTPLVDRHRSSSRWLVAALALAGLAACKRSDTSATARPTQAALGTAISRVAIPATSEAEREEALRRERSERAPAMRVEGGSLVVQSDDDHQGAHGTQVPQGWAVTWGDRGHQRAFLLLTDGAGAVRQQPALVRQAVSEEEEIYPPDVVATRAGYAMSWTDPSNGRVRFARLDAARRPVGRASIVHDGLESPRTTRLASHGSEHGIAVQLDRGVYFARVDSEGARVGAGHLLAEDVAVTGLDHVTVTAAGYEVRWHEEGGAVRSASVSRDGRVAVRTVSDPTRIASR